VTRGSSGIAWTSDTYIGPNGVQLVFGANFDSLGDIHTSASNVDTVARFISNQEEQGVTVLVSTLSINPLPDPQNASVTCIHTASGQRDTINFQVIGKLFYYTSTISRFLFSIQMRLLNWRMSFPFR
jgi:hypothetical protein